MIKVQMETVQTEPSQISPSPSLNSYSSETLTEIATRVLEEFQRDPHSVSPDSLFGSWENDNFHRRDDGHGNVDADDDNNNDDDGFEFAFVCRDPQSSPVSADDIFYNGQIMPMYPLFKQNLLFSEGNKFGPGNGDVASISPTQKTNETAPVLHPRLPLRNLMFEERETGSFSSSTSEADDHDFDDVPPGTYCVWTPKSAAADSTERSCKKSNSAGSFSKRWNLRNLLIRSHSDGKEPPIMFLGTSKRTNRVAQEVSKSNEKPNSGGYDKSATASSNEKETKYYTRNRAMATAGKEGEQAKRKSYLPYRQELVGLFSNVHGVSRKLHLF